MDFDVLTRRKKAVSRLIRFCALLQIAGLCCLYFFPLHFSRATYVDENALKTDFVVNFAERSRMDRLLRMNYPSGNQNFTNWISNELGSRSIENYILNEDVVFGVVRSPRAQNLGCVCLCLHYEREGLKPFSSISFGIFFAEYLENADFVGKDVLFVFIPKQRNSVDLMSKFLKVYYALDDLLQFPLFQRMGEITESIVLDFNFEG